MPVFGPDTLILLPDHTDFSGRQRWLLWPALRYRVVSPVVDERGLNAFQQAVLGLARSGLREPEDMSELLGLEPVLITAVVLDLKAHHYLDRYGSVTDTGRAVLRDGFVEPASNVISHVYQDVFSGALLPGSTSRVEPARAVWRSSTTVELNLGSAGVPAIKRTVAVLVGGTEPVEAPTAEDIVETVSTSTRIRRGGRGADRRWLSAAPERIVSRVSFIGLADATYVPLVLRADNRNNTTSWSVGNTFTGRDSPLLRSLVATRAQKQDLVRKVLEALIGRQNEHVLAEYERLDVELRRTAANSLELRFTSELRRHPHLIELLTLLERDREHGQHTGALGATAEVGMVVQRAWQVHELVLRELIIRYPVPEQVLAGLGGSMPRYFGECCRRIGLDYAEYTVVRRVSVKDLMRNRIPGSDTKVAHLFALNLVAAADEPAHPLRQLAAHHPQVLSRMHAIAHDRNQVAHAELAVLNHEHAESARKLAHDTVAAFLGLPIAAEESRIG